MHPRAVAHDDTPRSLRGEGLIAHTTVYHWGPEMPRPNLRATARGRLVLLPVLRRRLLAA